MFTCNELCIYELLIHKSSGINVKHMCAMDGLITFWRIPVGFYFLILQLSSNCVFRTMLVSHLTNVFETNTFLWVSGASQKSFPVLVELAETRVWLNDVVFPVLNIDDLCTILVYLAVHHAHDDGVSPVILLFAFLLLY